MASSSFIIGSRAEDVQFALQRAKKKISNLQQQLINQETSSESPETSLTWTPSKELRDSLVDMYQANPGVNLELRQRLPSPATQQLSNSTQQLSNSTQQLSNSAQQLSNSTQQLSSPDRSGTSLSLDPTDQAPQHLPEPPSSCFPSPLSHRRSVSPVSPLLHRRSVSPVSPLLHRRSVSPVSPLLHRRSVSPVSPLLHRRSVSPVSPSSSRPAGGAEQMELDLSPSRGLSPRVESCGHGSDGERGPGSPVLRRHLVSTDESSHPASGRRLTLDRDQNISFLLKELETLREITKKLQEELLHKEEELQRREVEEELKEELREAQGWERPAAVLEEVLAAQKDRDQALMSRLLLANEERDEALLRACQLQQAAESEDVPIDGADLDVDELLQSVRDADSVQEVQRFGSVLVQRLRLARQRRDDITAQEMKAVMEERDGSVAKSKRLEQEVIQEREQRASERKRGGALEDRRRLEAELQELRANHSSSHTSEDLLAPLPSPPGDVLLTAAHQAPPLLVQVQQLSKEKQSVEAELQCCQEAEREASERVRRLERLVEVLRKKVGTGSLRAVV